MWSASRRLVIGSWTFCLFFSRWLFFFKQKTAYEMGISDWSSDVCSSDLVLHALVGGLVGLRVELRQHLLKEVVEVLHQRAALGVALPREHAGQIGRASCRERVCQYV